jgi:hypothetical protein
MNRLQNLVLVIWAVVLLLFVAFNWQMIWKPVDVVFLFMDFNLSLLLWLVLAGFGVALLLRVLASGAVRTGRRRAEKEIHMIKAKAFDGVTDEFERMVNDVKKHLDERIRSLTAQAPAPPVSSPEPATPPKEEGAAEPSENEGDAWRALAGAASTDEAAEGAAAEDTPASAEASQEKKPKRGRKGKA